jgi:hypothetical protein
MRRWAIAGAVVVFVLGALFVVRPFVSAQRQMPSEIVSPASLFTTASVPLDPGHPVCFGNAVAERHSELVSFRVSAPNGPAPQLTVTVKGPGYDAKAVIPAGLTDGQNAQAPIPAPPYDVPVRVCIRNDGKTPTALFAAADRTHSRSLAQIDGKTVQASVWFGFYEPRWRAISERVPLTIDRMTVFRPGYVTSWVLWIIAILFLAGVPIAAVWALVRALREDGADDPSKVDVRVRRRTWQRFLD